MTTRLLLAALAFLVLQVRADDEFPITEDSKPHDGIAKGELIKDTYTAKQDSLFPGTEREYVIYLPPNLDKTKHAPFMVFQDGVIYNAPTVFDNLIAKKEIPAMIGIFIKPGVVPAANPNALPRYNRSYEYDSVTDNYARLLIDEFLPAIKEKHGLNLSDDPNARAIAGNSSGGICAFMVAWHRPDQFRRVFTGVGTYVGIHGADQLPVLVRKYEPKPLRVWLQSGENDNNLYCGDWWMANQMMERSLTWNGYEVNHTWGNGGHNAKHATQIFPEVLRWLWKGYPDEPVKANPRGDAKWVGGQVVGDGEWKQVGLPNNITIKGRTKLTWQENACLTANKDGDVFVIHADLHSLLILPTSGVATVQEIDHAVWPRASVTKTGDLCVTLRDSDLGYQASQLAIMTPKGKITTVFEHGLSSGRACVSLNVGTHLAIDYDGDWRVNVFSEADARPKEYSFYFGDSGSWPSRFAISPDQTILYLSTTPTNRIWAMSLQKDGTPQSAQSFGQLEIGYDGSTHAGGMCVDTNGWLYVATSLGIQVLDQAGRVNFIVPTPKPPHDVCFGGKDLSDLFIACGDTIYKRHTKAHGYISGQMAPIKPPAPKL